MIPPNCPQCKHVMVEAYKYNGENKFPIWLCSWCRKYTTRVEEKKAEGKNDTNIEVTK